MSKDDKPSARLLRLRERLPASTLERMETLLSSRTEKLSTGRMGRAVRASRLAIGGGTKVIGDRARRLVGFESDGGHSVELAADIVEAMAEMRGIAMKVGQMMSYMEGVMPPEAQKVLTLLQRDAPPMAWDVVRAQIEGELGASPESLFEDFEPEPIAAASIGQVHRAKTRDGIEVAVKVQYPGIHDAMAADLKNVRFFGALKGLFFSNVDTKALLQELEERFLEECDYTKEAEYQRVFRARFAGHPTIIIPEVHDQLSGHRVLTTTFHEGRDFYEWLASNPSDAQRRRVAQTIYRFYLGSLYMDGLFNCDPHPGNYLFAEDGRIVFLDHGCVRRFSDERREGWINMCRAIADDDPALIHQRALEVGFFKEGAKYDEAGLRSLLRYLYQAHLEDGEFDFRRMAPHATFQQMFVDNPNLFKMNMPADAAFLNRITFGLVSLLSEIGATVNCHRAVLGYFDGWDPDWPDDPNRRARQAS